MNFDILNKTTTLVTKRNSGKSMLLKYLVTLRRKCFNKVFVICPTEVVNGFYQKKNIIPKECVYEQYDESWVNSLIEKMTKINKEKPQNEMKQVLLVIDDVIADTNFHQSPSLKKLFVRSRHIGIAVIITAQYLNSIPPIARTNSDYVLVGQLNKQGLDILTDEFIRAGMQKEDFVQLYKDNTRDYMFFLINNNSTKTEDLDEVYGHIKTPEDFVKGNN